MTTTPAVRLSPEEMLKAYKSMRMIREFEERVRVEFGRGDIPGFVHLYAGEEAVAVGVVSHLTDTDRISSTHRGHGHCIAKGVDVVGMMKEIYGKQGGVCGGKGGSMHIADFSKGMMGANGIVGAGAPLICGAALAAKMRGNGDVAVCFFGDGASNQGSVLESMNLAASWKLPVIFVLENNGYAEATLREYAVAVDSFVHRAAGFGMPGVTVNGNDYFAVHEAAGDAIARARKGGGPTLLECVTDRFYGHFEGDAQTYRPPGELEEIRRNRDCLKIFTKRVTEAGFITTAQLEEVDRSVLDLIETSVNEAKSAPLPTLADLTSNVYVKY